MPGGVASCELSLNRFCRLVKHHCLRRLEECSTRQKRPAWTRVRRCARGRLRGLSQPPACGACHTAGMASPDERTLTSRDFPVHWPVLTRWTDNDMFGHLNNAVYYELFDTAINGWINTTLGLDP